MHEILGVQYFNEYVVYIRKRKCKYYECFYLVIWRLSPLDKKEQKGKNGTDNNSKK